MAEPHSHCHWTTTTSHHHHSLSASLLLLLLLLFFAVAPGGACALAGRRRGAARADEWGPEAAARRRLVGPGSAPPTCRGRCGGCFPCRPVHVAIQPGRSFPLEYYPEAWRCKCGNKFFMP